MRNLLYLLLPILFVIASCSEDPIPGCTDPAANNYNSLATESDGSCMYTITGCTDPNAANYDPDANTDSGNCQYPGCTDMQSDQFDETANVDDGSCSTYFDRWTATFAGDFICDGIFDQFFGDATMSFAKVDEPDNLDSVEVLIEFSLSQLPLNFGAIITRDSMYANAFFEGIQVDSVDLIPNLDETYNITLNGVLAISDDNQMINGTLNIFVEETSTGFDFKEEDDCTFEGFKQ